MVRIWTNKKQLHIAFAPSDILNSRALRCFQNCKTIFEHKEVGFDLMNKIIEKLGDQVVVDGKAQANGRNLIFMVRHK